MRILRTADRYFVGLEGYPFRPRYADVTDGRGATLRMHYIDEGPEAAPAVLLLHGEPTWSYLYRHIVAMLVAAGHRCVAPDLIGFGRSDKPEAATDHTYARHVAWLQNLVCDHLRLSGMTLFAQDWGGLVGLRLLAAEPARFARVVISNTGLPTGDEQLPEPFLRWQRYAATANPFAVGQIVSRGCAGELPASAIAAYDAPFPDESYKAAVRTFPSLVPTRPDDPAHHDNVAAWEALHSFDRPFLCAFSDDDPLTTGAERRFIAEVRGARGQPHVTLSGAGHFVQEDRPAEVSRLLIAFIGSA